MYAGYYNSEFGEGVRAIEPGPVKPIVFEPAVQIHMFDASR